MAEYGFECRNCKNTFTLFIRVTERMKAAVQCPVAEAPRWSH
jgi:hypothetical protein